MAILVENLLAIATGLAHKKTRESFEVYDAYIDDQWGRQMRTTVTIDDALFERALQVADPGIEKADLIREAVKTYVRVHSAKRLVALGGGSASDA